MQPVLADLTAIAKVIRAVRPVGRVEPLSPRERTILREIHTGATNKVIGHRVGIAERTVKVYVGRIFAKLCVSNRITAALMAEGNPELIAEPKTATVDACTAGPCSS